MLDERFEALIKRTFECDGQSELPKSTLRVAAQYWQDYIKPKYAGLLDDEGFDHTPYRVPLPGIKNQSKTKNLHEGFWFMEQYIPPSLHGTSMFLTEYHIGNK